MGRGRCDRLAERLARFQPEYVVASTEAKAIETAEIVAERLRLTVEIADGVHEHERDDVPLMERSEFEHSVARFFARPAELVLGRETAAQAHLRFVGAIEEIMASRESGNVAVFTHGTVMTLLVSRAVGLEPYRFWQSLGMPAICALRWPELDILALIPTVE